MYNVYSLVCIKCQCKNDLGDFLVKKNINNLCHFRNKVTKNVFDSNFGMSQNERTFFSERPAHYVIKNTENKNKTSVSLNDRGYKSIFHLFLVKKKL